MLRHCTAIRSSIYDWMVFQQLKQTECEMSKFKFDLSHFLIQYHVIDSLIFNISVTLQNDSTLLLELDLPTTRGM